MTLSKDQFKLLQIALLDSFTTVRELRQFARVELDVHLDHVTSDGNLRERVFELIDWADRRGSIEELIEGSLAYCPGNPQLKKFGRPLGKESHISPHGATVIRDRSREPQPEPPVIPMRHIFIDATWWTGLNDEREPGAPDFAYNNLRVYCTRPSVLTVVRTMTANRRITIDLQEVGVRVSEERTNRIEEFAAAWAVMQPTVIHRADVNWVLTRYTPSEEVRFESYSLHHVAITFDPAYVRGATLIIRVNKGSLSRRLNDHYLLVQGETEATR